MSTSLQFQLRAGTLAPTAPAATAFGAFWQRLWAALERHGQRRAAAELRRIAILHAFSDPALNRQLLDAADRAERG